jgi:molybdopterin molybdotransferase
MLSFEQALQNLLDAATLPRAHETLPLLQARGRVLASDVLADIEVPPADNSAMDGYALRVADLARGQALPISQRIPAGSVPTPLQAGTAARIFTGAPIPAGADAVVMQEQCSLDGERVQINQAPHAGQNIRRAGEDIARGSRVLVAGRVLGPAELGLAASLGIASLPVWQRLRVAVFFTGDELQAPGQPLAPGQIYNSNRYVLVSQLEALGCSVHDIGSVPDDLAATRAALRLAAQDSNLIITCGGVSVGEEDHVKAALEAEGSLQSWRVGIRPGKPLAFGRVGEVPFVGLPGNPVSSFVTFQMLVRPYLRRLQGLAEVLPKPVPMRADFASKKPLPVREFMRVRCNAAGGLDLFPQQGSGVLSSCTWAEGFVSNPPETVIQPGDIVSYLPFGALP